MKDVRKHGQDVTLTMTVDCAVPDEYLIQIARELKPFGRLLLRINHEATGNWFTFSRRYTYQQVAGFYVRFHNIVKQEAPHIKTILCIGGEAKTGQRKCLTRRSSGKLPGSRYMVGRLLPGIELGLAIQYSGARRQIPQAV